MAPSSHHQGLEASEIWLWTVYGNSEWEGILRGRDPARADSAIKSLPRRKRPEREHPRLRPGPAPTEPLDSATLEVSLPELKFRDPQANALLSLLPTTG